jgi:hypothetical protein
MKPSTSSTVYFPKYFMFDQNITESITERIVERIMEIDMKEIILEETEDYCHVFQIINGDVCFIRYIKAMSGDLCQISRKGVDNKSFKKAMAFYKENVDEDKYINKKDANRLS